VTRVIKLKGAKMDKKEMLKEINIYELMKSLNEEEIWDLIFHSTNKE